MADTFARKVVSMREIRVCDGKKQCKVSRGELEHDEVSQIAAMSQSGVTEWEIRHVNQT